ncbi:MAG: ribulose-phosphate 3-epimerase, partial [Mycoplasmataceae bacterium]|nr:ribulose-phosphate 3-epimerase [Mycoplasmataceae bacterium]
MEKVSASILGQENKSELVNSLIKIGIKQIHYDVMDGTFIPKKHSLPFEQIREIIKTTDKHIVDVHLMITDPDRQIQQIKDIADHITFHYESESIDRMRKLFRKNYGLPIGIAINP